jgi:hypothetical protein
MESAEGEISARLASALASPRSGSGIELRPRYAALAQSFR